MGGYVYAVAGGKGGVGKTTTVLNVAAALQRTGVDTAVVDADLGMTNLGKLGGIDTEHSVHDVLAGTASAREALADGPAGVSVLAGERDLDAYRDADPANFPEAVGPLERDHDVVIVDTGAGLSHESLVPYGLADDVVVVTTTDRTAAVDAGKTVEMVRKVDGTVAGTVVTRTDDAAAVDETADTVGEPLLGRVPEATELAGSEPMVVTAPDSDPAAAYRRLAGTLASRAGVDVRPTGTGEPAGDGAASDSAADADANRIISPTPD